MHGHCSLLNEQAMSLGIPQTSQFHPYGTPELAQSAIELVNSQTDFFILKDHGFVALGEDIKSCGRLTLDYYEKLVRMLAG